MRKGEHFKGEMIAGETITLDGKAFEQCRLKDCELIWYGYQAFAMSGCTVDPSCSWQFRGTAKLVVKMLRDLYRGGFDTLVDNLIGQIRTKPSGLISLDDLSQPPH